VSTVRRFIAKRCAVFITCGANQNENGPGECRSRFAMFEWLSA